MIATLRALLVLAGILEPRPYVPSVSWCCGHPARAHDDDGCPATGCPCSHDHRVHVS